MTNQRNLVLIDRHIANLQKERDDLEWSGNFERSDFLQKLIGYAKVLRDNGEVYYPLF